jgi:pimeloyl-ACP methyl ester carboxylesterase
MAGGYLIRPDELRGLAGQLRMGVDDFSHVDARSDFAPALVGSQTLTDALVGFARGWEEGRADLSTAVRRCAAAIDAAVDNYLDAERVCNVNTTRPSADTPNRATRSAEARPPHGPGNVGPVLTGALVRTRDRAAARLDELDSVLAAPRGFGEAEVVRLRAERAMLIALTERVQRNGPGHPVSFLKFDGSGAGRSIEVHGDLARATRVVVLVPGMDNDVTDLFSGSLDRGLSFHGLRDADALYRQLRAAAPQEQVAVIGWLDYTTPRTPNLGRTMADPVAGIRDVAALDPALAIAAAPRLAQFVHDLGEAGLPPERVTVIGHSYGSVVVAQSLRSGLEADAAVLLGNPGPGPGVERRSQLGSPNTTLYHAFASSDWLAPVHGVAAITGTAPYGTPVSEPGFGSVELDAAGVRGHSGYVTHGGDPLANPPASAAALRSVILREHNPAPAGP